MMKETLKAKFGWVPESLPSNPSWPRLLLCSLESMHEADVEFFVSRYF